MGYSSMYDHCYVLDPGVGGLVFSDSNSAGTPITNTAVENVFCKSKVAFSSPAVTSGQYAIWVKDTTGKVTDGYCQDNITDGCGDYSLRIERAAGWFITGNHVYNNQQGGMYFGAVWCTYIHHNEVDHFAQAGAADTTYYGMDLETILENDQPADGRPSVIDHNVVNSNESLGTSSTIYHYYRLRNATTAGYSSTQFDHNFAHRDAVGTGTSVAWDYEPNGGQMNLFGGFNVADGPSAVPVVGNGTLTQAAPSRVMYARSQTVTLGVSNSFGTATTFAAEQSSLGIIPTAIALVWGGTFKSDTVIARIVATYGNGTTSTVAFPAVTSAETQAANDAVRFSLHKDGQYLTSLAVSAKTGNASTSVTLTAEIAGFNAN
jgi:hypothetical protein